MSLDLYLHYEIDGNEIDVYDRNITHNLARMAGKAGLYKHLWRPEEVKVKKAKDSIKALEKGLEKLKAKPEYFKKFNPESGWGSYEGLVKFVEDYLAACKKYPNAVPYANR